MRRQPAFLDFNVLTDNRMFFRLGVVGVMAVGFSEILPWDFSRHFC
jgi:hypothetical protein